MTVTVAALFVDKRGPYWGRSDIDAWDIERDARKYDGPWPVVAHPPCQLWVNLAASKDGAQPAVRRLDVPGGWLYQVESHEILSGSRLVTRVWQPPVFVASGTCHYCEMIHNCDRGRP